MEEQNTELSGKEKGKRTIHTLKKLAEIKKSPPATQWKINWESTA